MAKSKAKGKANVQTFKKGDRVKIVSGEWGNSMATVLGVAPGGAVKVEADSARGVPHLEALDNLAAA